ncbi:HK97 family phage prohead protease [Bradyrhizobium sp. CB2312]|uniref:HK97 family phage prohead protease n=1 Tax=Bradyrhizobium sp. CB2312 TaxID=3039155 RepID=UPI0024B24020|nr:HK97 family phage prohead protease [Bradyrhizobium sp. CB2312]WFU76592.1 HK97 family phage prohead protease [Bradyrhizobium sp. CB2312]
MDRLEVKATLSVSDEGEITGIAWPFNAGPDSYGDLITKGAFGAILPDLPILYQHRPDDLVGTWNEVKETEDGLTVKGQLHLDQPRARSIRAMLKTRLVTGLSIGFYTKAARKLARGRIIDALDLAEISLVRDPAHSRARITGTKSDDAARAVADLIKRFTATLNS